MNKAILIICAISLGALDSSQAAESATNTNRPPWRTNVVASCEGVFIHNKDASTSRVDCALVEYVQTTDIPSLHHRHSPLRVALVEESGSKEIIWSYWPHWPYEYDFTIATGTEGSIMASVDGYAIYVIDHFDRNSIALSQKPSPGPAPKVIDLIELIGQETFHGDQGVIGSDLRANVTISRLYNDGSWHIEVVGKGAKKYLLTQSGGKWFWDH